jgi:16S rRNA (uracil1498-N3)-methyltransferase
MIDTDHTPSSRTPRLFINAALTPGATASLGPEQTHYLLRVMRLSPGREVLVFNGRDGLFAAKLAGNDRRRIGVEVGEQLAPQSKSDGPWLAFGVPKRPALETIIQKGTEMGVSRFFPIVTQRAIAERLNLDRLDRIAIEAAEQCERLDIPLIEPLLRLEDLLHGWPPERALLWCDEHGKGDHLADAADGLLDEENDSVRPWGLMIGPEGGFASGELDGLDEVPFVTRVTLGPRIMRADTAAIAALAIGQSLAGDGDLPVRSAT